MNADISMMRLALEQGRAAAQAGEIPVGAVVVRNGEVIATGYNTPIASHDPCAHAEIVALRAASAALKNYRLEDCELFVTLEPCAMCAGAILHARLKRVVFGATDPKTGAAGSVINLFEQVQLNHHTAVEGGLLASECALPLQQFFQQIRKNRVHSPLREDAVRTPLSRFDNLPGYPWKGHYLSDLPALDGLQMHYLDEGPSDASTTFLCLHGNPGWSYLYRKMLPVWTGRGCRVVAPDLIGFGKSDKPKRSDFHNFEFHRQYLLEFIERLDLRNVVLVVQDWGGLLGLTLPMENPGRYTGLLVMNTMLATGEAPLSPGFLAWRDMCARKPDFDVGHLLGRGNPHISPAECDAYNAPFPDAGHRAALRAFPQMVPEHPSDPGAAYAQKARDFWQHRWNGVSYMVVGKQDPVLGLRVMQDLQKLIRNCPEPDVLQEAGHFVQEHGAHIAEMALERFPL